MNRSYNLTLLLMHLSLQRASEDNPEFQDCVSRRKPDNSPCPENGAFLKQVEQFPNSQHLPNQPFLDLKHRSDSNIFVSLRSYLRLEPLQNLSRLRFHKVVY